MVALILASVLTTCVGQTLYALIVLQKSRYTTLTRLAVSVPCLASSGGGLWFVLSRLTGGDSLIPALMFVGWQALAITLVVGSGLRGVVRDGKLEQDTNTRIREMQERGQHDQPEEQADRTEGHQHRTDIDARLRADTETRSQERQDDREERAEERRVDRGERADEQQEKESEDGGG